MEFLKKLFGKKVRSSASNFNETASDRLQPTKPDVNKPVENPKLSGLLRQYEQLRTDDVLNEVYQEIAVNAHFLSVVNMTEEPETAVDGVITLKKNTTIQFPMLSTIDGHSFFPVFTDWFELSKWEAIKAPKTFILSFDDYAAMVCDDEKSEGIVINPFSDNLIISRQMVKHIKTTKDINITGMSHQEITKGTTVLLGEPKNYPSDMVRAISDYVRKIKEVKRVWLRLMEKEKEQSFLLVVEFTGDRRKIFDGIANTARSFLHGMYLDMVPYHEGFGKRAVENVIPFYQASTKRQ